jgi:hypothetical protein
LGSFIRNESLEHRTEFDHPVPVAVTPRQTRHLCNKHHPDLAQANRCDQALEPSPLMAAGAGHSQIIIDDLNLRRRPPHVFRTLGQLILPSRALLVLQHLTLR